MTENLVDILAVLALGLTVGSFLNVVVVRLPAGDSLWTPRSRCPGCGVPIAWYDNVPVVSFIALRGRCRACRMAISWRYPIVELATAALWLGAYAVFGRSPQFVIAIVLLSALIAITAIDLAQQIIPDVITLPGIVVGVLANLVAGPVGWRDALIGAAAGGAILLVIIVASGGGMGGGDMKLAAMLGAFLGWKAMLASLLVAVVLGGALAVALLAAGRLGRKDPIPFGPFLALGGVVGLFWGVRLVEWYTSAFMPGR